MTSEVASKYTPLSKVRELKSLLKNKDGLTRENIGLDLSNRGYLYRVRDEEENIRKAAKKIEAIIKQFESNYAVKDKQDLLAMRALQMSTKVQNSEGKAVVDTSDLDRNIDAIEGKIFAMLERSFT